MVVVTLYERYLLIPNLIQIKTPYKCNAMFIVCVYRTHRELNVLGYNVAKCILCHTSSGKNRLGRIWR